MTFKCLSKLVSTMKMLVPTTLCQRVDICANIMKVLMETWHKVLITENKKTLFRSSHLEVFLWKGVLKICSKFTEHPCQSAISIKLLCNFIEITLRHGCSPVNLMHIFRTPFHRNTSWWLLLPFTDKRSWNYGLKLDSLVKVQR